MPHLFERRNGLGNSAAVWVLAAMMFAAPIAWRSLSSLKIANEVDQWLPADDPSMRITDWAGRQFPGDDHLIISWNGSALGDPRVDALARQLEPVRDRDGIPRGGVPQIASVTEPHELLESIQRQEVPSQEAVRRLQGTLIGAGPLRVRLTDAGRMRVRRLQRELADAAQRDLGLGIHILEPTADLATTAMIPGLGEDSQPSVAAVLAPAGDLLSDATVDHDLTITWPGLGVGTPQTLTLAAWLADYRASDALETPLVDQCFFVPGAPVALAVTLSEAGLADKPEAIQRIREAARDVGIAETDLQIGGSALTNIQLYDAISQMAWNAAFPITRLPRRSILLTSLLICAGLACLLLRDLRLTLVVLFSALFSAFVTTSIACALFGALDLVTVLLPVFTLMVGLLLSLQAANEWRLANATNPHAAAVTACRSTLRPCLLIASAAAIGAASLCLCPLAPVRRFGLCAGIGCLASFLMAVYGVPALLLFWRGKSSVLEEHLDRAIWRWWGSIVTTRLSWLSPVLIAVGLLPLIGFNGFDAAPPIIGEFAKSTRFAQDQSALEDHLSGMARVETIVRFDAAAQDEANFFDRLELVRAIEEHLRKHPALTGCRALPDFHPVSETPEEGASMVARNRHHKRSQALQEDIRNGDSIGSASYYALVSDDAPAADLNLAQPGDELWRIVAHAKSLTAIEQSAIVHDVEEIAREVLRFQSGAQHVVAGDMARTARLQAMTTDGFTRASLVTCAAFLVLLLIELRSIPAALTALLANAVAIAAVLGVSRLLGMTIDLGLMLAAPLTIAIAAGGTLASLTRFRSSYAKGLSRREAVVSSLTDSGPILVQAGVSLAAGLCVLTSAELLAVSRFGALLAGTLAATALIQAIVLPQLLSSALGRWFTTGVTPVFRASATSDSETAPPREAAA
jgi:predicted RND superfamily exporter protein